MPNPIAAGDGSELRLLDEGTVEELFTLAEKNRAELERWLPSWADATTSRDECRSVIRHSLQRHAVGSGHVFGIRSECGLVGVVGLSITAPWEGEIGYWLDFEHRDRGMATRSVHAVTEYAFDAQRLSIVRIVCEPENVRACAIPERLGFEVQATTASQGKSTSPRRYAMTADRWVRRGVR